MIFGSFVLLIVAGTIGLKCLPGLTTDEPLPWTDALFTVTSAVCVTGLIVVDTATYFTPVGQAFLLGLIQLGGLGMLTLTNVLIRMLGFRLSLRGQAVHDVDHQIAPSISVRRLAIDVLWFTLFVEGCGAVALWLAWGARWSWVDGVWPAVFHSVSAFCNAGFSTRSDSLVSMADHPLVLAIISALIIVGGIGFLVLEELFAAVFRRGRRLARGFSLHTRMVLVTTLVLLLVPWPMFAFFESDHTLSEGSVTQVATGALFMSVTARTAGFNTIDYAEASNSANFLTILLMVVGGAPGSTAGGMKVTTLAVVAAMAVARMRGRSTVIFANRSIPEATVQTAAGLVVMSTALTVGGVFALSVTEGTTTDGGGFLALLFETVSAINTVGLSMNYTSTLSPAGRWVLVAVMFLGRVGPLTFASALVGPRSVQRPYRLAYENVGIG